MKRSLRCFVAMAFEHGDTDSLYRLAIRSLLVEQRIKPIRVDRVEHQERIDQFIIDNIDAADFVIADLTYARPSVYYEAGYAESRIPVIYTCRRDHFGGGARASDGYQLKIHFDLITKNIIGWSNPGDPTFVKRLRKRVNFVTQPLLRDRRSVEERQKQIKEFKAKPLSVRLEAIASSLRAAIRSHRFDYLDRRSSFQDLVPEKDGDAYNGDSTNEIVEKITETIFPFENRYAEDVARHVHNKTLTMIFATVVSHLTPTDLKRFRMLLLRAPAYDLTPAGTGLRHVIERYIICSTSKLDIDSAMNKLHQFSRQGDLLTWTTTEEVPVQRPPGFRETYSGPHRSYVFVRREHGSPVFRIAEPVAPWEESKRKALRLREIPRTRIFSLIGGISSTEEVVDRVSSAITNSIAWTDPERKNEATSKYKYTGTSHR